MSQRELLPIIALAIVFSPLVIGLAYWLWHVMRKRKRAKARAALAASGRPPGEVDDLTLTEKIDKALASVERHGGDRLPHMSSIKKQLLWCRSYLSGRHGYLEGVAEHNLTCREGEYWYDPHVRKCVRCS